MKTRFYRGATFFIPSFKRRTPFETVTLAVSLAKLRNAHPFLGIRPAQMAIQNGGRAVLCCTVFT